MGTTSQLIVGVTASYGRFQDAVLLTTMRRQVRRYAQPNWKLVADAGFDGRQVREGDLIPPVRRHGALRASERRARADLVAQARLDGLYGQRWKCETVHSVLKRQCGDTIRSRSTRRQFREIVVKALIYNLHVI